MSLALVRKEVREHGWVFAAVVAFDALGLAGQLSSASDQGGRFSALVRFAGLLGLSALVAANRLFAREYAGKTQLFLEVLPITRAQVLATKWAVGAAFQCGLVAAAWLVTLQYMRQTEVISWPDALRALLAVQAFTLAVWSFAAMAGLLGRYRYVAWMAFGLFYFFLNEVALVPMGEAPLLRLLNETSAMARTPVPARALGEAAVVVLGSVLVTLVLGLRGSGAMAAALSRRMTARERVFVLTSFILTSAVAMKLKQERELPDFDLAQATRSTSPRGVVGVMKTDDVDEARARALGEAVARDVDSLTDALHLEGRPAIFLLPQRGLEPTTTQRASLTGAQGIVVRASPDAEPTVLRARVLHELLGDATQSRGLKEDRHALLDGLAVWWTVQGDAEARERWWRRAAAASLALTPASVARWGETTERLGECLASALAFALVDSLVEQVGREKVLALGAQLFSTPRGGVLAVLFEQKPAALLRAAGTDWDRLTSAAQARRAAVPLEPRAARAALEVKHGAEGDVVAVHVTGVERWRVLYGPLGPWARGQSNLPRLEVRGTDATLPLTLSRGARVLAIVEYDDAALGCPVRLAAQRLEAP